MLPADPRVALVRRFRRLGVFAVLVAALAVVQILTHERQVAAACAEDRFLCGLVTGWMTMVAKWVVPPAVAVAALSFAAPAWVARGRRVLSGWWFLAGGVGLVGLAASIDAARWTAFIRVVAACGHACPAPEFWWWDLASLGTYACAAAGGASIAVALAAGRGVPARREADAA